MKVIITNYDAQETIEFQRNLLTAFDIEEQIYIFWKLDPCSPSWKEEIYLHQKTLFLSYENNSLYIVSLKKEKDDMIKITIDKA